MSNDFNQVYMTDLNPNKMNRHYQNGSKVFDIIINGIVRLRDNNFVG